MRLRSGGMTILCLPTVGRARCCRRRRRHPHLHHVRGGRRPARRLRCGGHRPREPAVPPGAGTGRPAGEPHLTHPPAGGHAHRDHPRRRRPRPVVDGRGDGRGLVGRPRPRCAAAGPGRRGRGAGGRPTAWPRKAIRHGSRPWRSPVGRHRGRARWATGPGGCLPDQGGADDVERGRLAAAGHPASSVFTGWDGDPSPAARGTQGGHHRPAKFRGGLGATYGPDLRDRETTSALSAAAGATVGVNAGYFVLDPASGAPGDPAGVGVYRGRLLSEPIAGRPALVLREDARRHRVRAAVGGRARSRARPSRLDGIDRVPGLIRNCGGDATDLPTALPLHDITCTDDSEWSPSRRSSARRPRPGPGARSSSTRGAVVAVLRTPRGGPPCGGADGRSRRPAPGRARGPPPASVTGCGSHRGLLDGHGAPVRPRAATSIVNGGPQLVRDGRWDVTLRRDGLVHPDDPSFLYGWASKRNPRTFAGVDAQGRTVLVTADGRSTADLGLSIPETADVARSLGLVDAINLDGGGSTGDGRQRAAGDAPLRPDRRASGRRRVARAPVEALSMREGVARVGHPPRQGMGLGGGRDGRRQAEESVETRLLPSDQGEGDLGQEVLCR